MGWLRIAGITSNLQHNQAYHLNTARSLLRYTNVGKVLASDGVTLKQIRDHGAGRGANIPAINDRLQMQFEGDGTETILDIWTSQDTNAAKWRLYVNGVLDAATYYDDYAAAQTWIGRVITLTQPIQNGTNTLEIRPEDKNVASIDYMIYVMGAALM